MSNTQLYSIRDKSGNVYGPADANMLQDWVRQGRIVAGMSIAPDGTDAWAEASTHPTIAHLFNTSPTSSYSTPTSAYSSPVSTTALPQNPQPAYTPYQTPSQYTGQPRLNILALLSMIAGILSLPTFCCIFISPIFALSGGIMAIIALFQFSRSPEAYTGKGMAWAGLIASILGFLGSIIFFVLMMLAENRP